MAPMPAAALIALMATGAAALRVGSPVMMAKKPKKDVRVWLPPRSSPFAREVDAALQLVSRAAAGVGKATSAQMATVVAQALVCDGINSEFADDVIIAPETSASLQACDADTQKAALELINELGATNPCVNAFDPPYPEPVRAAALADEAEIGAKLDLGKATGIGPRTWVLAPVTTDSEQAAVSLTLIEYGHPVVCAVALPDLPRNAMSGDKLLRMTVSFDGQSGAVAPPVGTLLWAEEGIGAYERSIGGEHGTDVRVRADRSLIGLRNIETGQVTGVQKFAEVTRCESATYERAALLATQLGMTKPALKALGPFAYGLVARGEAQTYFELPDSAAEFDANIWAHAAGSLLVTESGGVVTDTVGHELDFSMCRESRTLPPQVLGVLVSNKDVHDDVVRQCGLATVEASANAK